MILLFRPKGTTATPEKPFSAMRPVTSGPNGLAGDVFAIPAVDGKVGYYPDSQTWIEGKPFWIGRDDTPTPPEALLRKEPIDGHWVTLEDGNKWLVPVVRVFPFGTSLPEALVLGPDGELVSKPLARFAKVVADADRVYDFFLDPDGAELMHSEAWSIANRALAVNYHVWPEFVSMAELLTTRNIAEVLKAMIDYPAIEAEIKKKQNTLDDINNTEDGNAD